MAINPDFRDLFAALNESGARYLLVGGYALAVHGVPRFTKDLDVWVEPSPENAVRVMAALRAFGAPTEGLTEADLAAGAVVSRSAFPQPHRHRHGHRRGGLREGVAGSHPDGLR